jgi:hypothetical protein
VLAYRAVCEECEREACITDFELVGYLIASLLKDRKIDIEKILLYFALM